MAKKKTNKISVSGLTVNDILNIPNTDISRMNRKDLSAITSRLVSASNKRIRRLQKSKYGQMAPAYRLYLNRGKFFSVKGKNVNELRTELKELKHFLTMKTSTVSGWKKVQKNLSERLGGTMTEEESEKFWSVYKKLEEQEGGLMRIINNSNQVQYLLRQEVTSTTGGSDKIFQKMMDNLDAIYEEMYSEEDSDWDVEDVFSYDFDF